MTSEPGTGRKLAEVGGGRLNRLNSVLAPLPPPGTQPLHVVQGSHTGENDLEKQPQKGVCLREGLCSLKCQVGIKDNGRGRERPLALTSACSLPTSSPAGVRELSGVTSWRPGFLQFPCGVTTFSATVTPFPPLTVLFRVVCEFSRHFLGMCDQI